MTYPDPIWPPSGHIPVCSCFRDSPATRAETHPCPECWYKSGPALLRSCLPLVILYFNASLSAPINMTSLSAVAPMRAALLQRSALRLPVRGAVAMHGLRIPALACTQVPLAGKRVISTTPEKQISSTREKQIKDYFPPPPHANVLQVETAWTHPVYVASHLRPLSAQS